MSKKSDTFAESGWEPKDAHEISGKRFHSAEPRHGETPIAQVAQGPAHKIAYPARLVPQADGSLLVQFVDLPDVFTEGMDVEDAITNASEALSGILTWHLEQGHEIPQPTCGLEGVAYVLPNVELQVAISPKVAVDKPRRISRAGTRLRGEE